MQGVGNELVNALRAEDTSGRADQYALRRLESLLDELTELPEARALICRTYHRSREVVERRRKLAAL